MDSTGVIQGIRELLAAGAQFDRNRLVELAAAYMQVCRDVNGRVARCHDFLARAMREQAAEEANTPPDLCSEIQTLGFDERSAWLGLCEQIGIDIRPFDFDAELAGRLVTDLSSDPNALQSLLRTHRLLALGHAPLAQRLHVLRRIASTDPLRAFWKEDVKAFEKRRLKELPPLVKKAWAAKDLATLEAILEELRSSPWVIPPPPALAARLEDGILPMRREIAGKHYAYLGEQIRAAHGGFDDATCRELLGKWRQVAEQTAVAPDPELAELVAPAESWLRDIDEELKREERYQKQCSALQSALDEGKDWPTILRHLDSILGDESAPPPGLVEAAERQIAKGQAAERRRRALRVGGIATVVVLAVVGGVLFWHWYQATRTEKGCLNKLTEYIEQGDKTGDYTTADDYVKHLEDYRPEIVADSKPIQILIAELARRKAEEQDRRTKLEAALAAAGAKVGAARKALGDAQTTIRGADGEAPLAEAERQLAQLHDTLSAAEPPLREADALAKRAEDAPRIKGVRDQIAGLRSQATKAKGEIAGSRSTALDRARDGVKAKYYKLEMHLAEVYDSCGEIDPALERSFAKAADQCIALAAELGARPDIAQHAGVIRTEIDAWKQKAGAKKRAIEVVRAALGRIQRLYTSPEILARELRNFGEKHAGHPLASPFESAARMVSGWRAAAAWVQLARNWRAEARVHTSAAATSYHDLVATHLTQYANTPYKKVIGPYQTYLQKAVASLPADGRIVGYQETDDLLRHATISHLFTVRAKNGKIYYTNNAAAKVTRPMPDRVIYTVRALRDGDGKTEVVSSLRHQIPAPPATGWPPAPQSVFAQAALRRLRGFRGRGWETFYLVLAQDVQGCTEMDPVLRASLLQVFLAQAAACLPVTPRTQVTTQDLLRNLGRLPLDVTWFWPDSAPANQARPRAAATLAEMVPLGPMIEDVDKQLAGLKAPLEPYRPVGGFFLADGGLHIGEQLGQGGLYVLQGDEEAVTFRRIGKVQEGKPPVLDAGATRSVPAGSIVYFRPE